MIKKRKNSMLWIAFTLMGIPSSSWLFTLVTSPSEAFPSEFFYGWLKFLSILSELCFPVVYRGWVHMDARIYEWAIQVNLSGVYSLFALGALSFSVYSWYTRPQKKTLLAMLFCGWIVCGFPGQVFALLTHVKMHGDTFIQPSVGDSVQMPDGRIFRLFSEEARHNPRLASGYDHVLPDGRSFYVVPRKQGRQR